MTKITYFIVAIVNLWVSTHLMANPVNDSLFQRIGEKYAVDPLLLYAIALNESAITIKNGYVAPHPYVFRDRDGAHYFDSHKAAALALSPRLKNTSHIDIGMMQINLHYHPVDNPLRLLEPVFNLEIAASYLKQTLSSTQNKVIGIGRYHSWKPLRASWYGNRIINTYNKLKNIHLN